MEQFLADSFSDTTGLSTSLVSDFILLTKDEQTVLIKAWATSKKDHLMGSRDGLAANKLAAEALIDSAIEVFDTIIDANE